jgi:hypothetical protein
VLCIVEAEQTSTEVCNPRLHRPGRLSACPEPPGRLILAYEPHWAIGTPRPASADHICTVCSALRGYVRSLPDFPASPVLYGSARPGLLSDIADPVDGVSSGVSLAILRPLVSFSTKPWVHPSPPVALLLSMTEARGEPMSEPSYPLRTPR